MSYKIEIAARGQAVCKGPEPCKGTKIDAKLLRFGSVQAENRFGGSSTYWRHWGCVTPKVIANAGATFNLLGFDQLPLEDQSRVETAFEKGHIDPEDSTPGCEQHVLPEELWSDEVRELVEEQKRIKKAERQQKQREKDKAKAEASEEDPEQKPAKKTKRKAEEVDVPTSLKKQSKTEKAVKAEKAPKKEKAPKAEKKEEEDGPKRGRGRSRKTVDVEETDAPAPKAARGRKAATKKTIDVE